MTTCRCGGEWSGTKLEHCTVCHRSFTGPTAGDAHRAGTFTPDMRRCLTDDEMRDKGLAPRPNRYGHQVWGSAIARPLRFVGGAEISDVSGVGVGYRDPEGSSTSQISTEAT